MQVQSSDRPLNGRSPTVLDTRVFLILPLPCGESSLPCGSPHSPEKIEALCPGMEKYRKEAPVDAQGLAVWSLTVVGIPPGTSDPTLRAGVTVRLCAQITAIRPQGPPNVTLSVACS